MAKRMTPGPAVALSDENRTVMRANGRAIDWPALAGPVARALLGEPNPGLSRRHELRYAQHGVISIDHTRGLWSDFETGEGGGVLDLIMREHRCDGAGAMRWLAETGLLDGFALNAVPVPLPTSPQTDDPARAALAAAIWQSSILPDNTPAHTYL